MSHNFEGLKEVSGGQADRRTCGQLSLIAKKRRGMLLGSETGSSNQLSPVYTSHKIVTTQPDRISVLPAHNRKQLAEEEENVEKNTGDFPFICGGEDEEK